MFPYLLFWAPQYRFPFSGAVEQDINPDLTAFFGAIPAAAGDGATERKVFERHSYGNQLGALHKAVRLLAQEAGLEQKAAIVDLVKLQDEIQAIKDGTKQARAATARTVMQRLRDSDEAAYRALLAELSDKH